MRLTESLATASTTEHVFSVDVEEYFHVHALAGVAPRASWDRFPSRLAHAIDVLLDLLGRRGATGTFFVLGWVAERHPHLVRRIAAHGHEIASHGWWHRRVCDLTPEEFRADVRDSRRLLEDLSGEPCVGFRAPSFSITPGTEWAFDVLLEEGYRYDSSLFPIRRAGYGYASCLPLPHYVTRPAGLLAEFPPTTLELAGLRLPAAGGGWFRHFPYGVTRMAFRECTRAGVPGVFYVHPWELDPDQPRLNVPLLTRWRHYGGLRATRPRLELLLDEFRFTSIAEQLSVAEVEEEWVPSQPVLVQ